MVYHFGSQIEGKALVSVEETRQLLYKNASLYKTDSLGEACHKIRTRRLRLAGLLDVLSLAVSRLGYGPLLRDTVPMAE